MSDLFTQSPKKTEASPIDNIFQGMLSLGNAIQRGIEWRWGNGTANVKPLDYGFTGAQFTYKWDKGLPTDPNISFFLKLKW